MTRSSVAGPVFFHLNRREKNIARAGCEEPLHDMIVELRIHIVDVGFDHEHLFL